MWPSGDNPQAQARRTTLGWVSTSQTDTSEAGPKTPASILDAELSDMMNKESNKYHSIKYEYDENLLELIDRAEAQLSGRSKGVAPRLIMGIPEQEEYDHLRETIKRWHERTGKDLRAEIDALKAEVASRKSGGPAFHPEFHKKFSAIFDDFIAIEVIEMRERRNKAIHEAARPLLEKYRATEPANVEKYEAMLRSPPYNLPEDADRPAK